MRTSSKAILPLILLVAACATNPVTGKKEFNIVSEQQEIAIGQQSHPDVIKEYGVYTEKPELTRMVESVGRRLAANSDRPNLPWTFTILDTPMVNAMAIPGGYIYITRGMLERINSEDELAGVLGHEVTHVTARHSAQQMSRAQVAQLGLVLGSVLAGPQATQAYGQLAQLGVGLLFQRYSRSHETQADLVGTGYVAKAGFNPVGAERMLMTLQRLNKNPASGIEKYFLSHPDPAKRVREVHAKVQELTQANPAVVTAEPKREPYLRLVDGIITSNSTQRIVIKGNTVYDRAHGMILQVPQGWTAVTGSGALFAMQPRNAQQGTQAAFIAQEVDLKDLGTGDVQSGVRNRLQQMGLQYAGSRQINAASGDRFPVDVWTGQTEAGAVGVETTQFGHGDHVAVFMFLSPSLQRNASPLGEVLQRTTMDAARARSVEPPRIRLGTVRQGDSWNSLAQSATGNSRDAEAVANMNGFDLATTPRAGMLVKLPQEIAPEER
jgi:predicted Zn-dependent protease